MRIGSGPAISTMPLSGSPTTMSARMAATSSAAMGCMRAGGKRTVCPSVADWAMPPTNSRNCVARTDDRVRDLGGLDQSLLGHHRAEVAAHEEALGADDRQRDVVGDAGGRFGGEEVPSRSLE